ncbi:MAG: GntR family transcriptional regulator [Rhodospirillales bacterium]|nr:GntR family transcriptional regulator [Rhodospirillales bacterium]
MNSSSSVAAQRDGGVDYLYRRIEAAVRAMIAAGGMAPGERLPSESTLAEQFRTTRVTVAKALAAIEREGLVRRLVGRGTFVADAASVTSMIDTSRILSFEEQMGLSGRTVTYQLLGFARIPAPPFARARLGMRAGVKLYRLERLRLVEGRVIGLEERYIPARFAARITGAMLARKGAVEIMGEFLGYHVPLIEVTLFPATADRRLARLLEVKPGSPVSVREHVLRDRVGQAVLCGRNKFTAEARISYVLGAGAMAEAGAQAASVQRAAHAN